jgi:hypothetical protein
MSCRSQNSLILCYHSVQDTFLLLFNLQLCVYDHEKRQLRQNFLTEQNWVRYGEIKAIGSVQLKVTLRIIFILKRDGNIKVY